MICLKCKAENEEGNIFCQNCGELFLLEIVDGNSEETIKLNNSSQTGNLPNSIKTEVLPIDEVVEYQTNKEVESEKSVNADIPKTVQIPSPAALFGKTIDNRYRLDSLIGAGGMGYVYQATRLQLNDKVAIKILQPDANNPQSVERFRLEAQASARLRLNAVIIYDYGVTDDGLFYIVMELLEGKTLRQLMKERSIPAVEAAEIIYQVSLALDEAHKLGIIHRDLKPENIFIDIKSDGLHTKILDFGIAKMRNVQTDNLTKAGFAIGTPRYMSPEQCLGEELDGRSDIYSLGIVAYEMLTGIVPFNSPTEAALYTQHLNQAPPSLRSINLSIPVEAENVVQRALQKNRHARQITAGQFANELKTSILNQSGQNFSAETVVRPINTMNFSGSGQFQQPPKSSKIPIILLGVLSVILLGVVSFLAYPYFIKQTTVLPDHFGVFNRKDDKFSAIKQRDFTSLLKARDELKEDSSLPVMQANPNVILYSDGQTIPVVDLKLIKLESIKDDGNIENWDYQVAPMDGNSDVKQIRVKSGLPKGRYALATLKGNLDEGTHKLWAFQVENGAETPAEAKIVTIALKATPTPTQTPQIIVKKVPVPQTSSTSSFSGATGLCVQNNVVMRSSPAVSDFNKIGRLDSGERVGILNYGPSDTWRGISSRWVYVQKANGKTGWVFGAFIR